MVKINDIEKDIKSLAHKFKIAVFNYDEIHNPNVDNQFHYDYKKVIKEVAKNQNMEESDAELILLNQGILHPLPNGEYEIDVGRTTRAGGGVNYGGNIFFSFSKNDYHTQYHELAHTLQSQYDLFDDSKIDSLYKRSESGIKNKQNAEKKLIDKTTYHNYLNEMHSEVFASAALMLRAENRRDFWWQAGQAYNMSINRNANAFMDMQKQEYATNHSSKFYSTKSVMRPLIKEIYKIRKSGQLNSYFDENGVINAEKLARLCEDVVIKNAYSPRTLNSFFKYKIFDGHTSEEKGWKRDIAQTFMETPLTLVLDMHNGFKNAYSSFKMHRQLRNKQNQQIFDFVSTPQTHHDPEIKALKEYERLKVAIDFYSQNYKNDDLKNILSDHIGKMGNSDMPDSAIRLLADRMGDKKSEKKQIEQAFRCIREIYRENKDDKDFHKLTQSQIHIFAVKNFIKMREENPQEAIIPHLEIEQRHGSATYPIKKQINVINNFVDQNNMSMRFRNNLLKELMNDPHIFEDPEVRKGIIKNKKFKNDFLGFKKRKFAKELNQAFDQISFSSYNNNDNPAYQNLRQVLSSCPPDQMLEKISLIEKTNEQQRGQANRQNMPQPVKQTTSTHDNEQQSEDNKKFAYVSAMRQKLTEGHNPQPTASEKDTPTFAQTTVSTEQIQRKLQENVKS